MAVISWIRIKTRAGGLFIFDTEGEPAVIARVHDRHEELVDFVAWRIERPGAWWLRRGDETPFLGTRNLAMAAYHGDPITLQPTPQEWLLAGRKGVCILKWGWPIARLFHGVGTISCSSPALQRKLISALRKWEPRVVVRRRARHA